MAAETPRPGQDQRRGGGGPARRRPREDLPPDPRQPGALLQGAEGGGLAHRLPREAGRRASSAGWAGCPPRSAPRIEGAGPGPTSRDHGRVRRAAEHRARLRAQRDRHRGHRRGRGHRGGARHAALRGPHPGHRHAGRGGRRRQGQADGGGRLQGRGRGHDDPRPLRHPGLAAEPRHHQGQVRVLRQGLARLVVALARGQRAQRDDPALRLARPDAPADQAATRACTASSPRAATRPTSSPSTRRPSSTCGRPPRTTARSCCGASRAAPRARQPRPAAR